MQKEWVKLKATLHALDNSEFQCGPCLAKYRTRPQQFEFKGCKDIKQGKLFSIDDKIHFRNCIGNHFDHSAVHWIQCHAQYEKGFLPFPGSLLEQPNKVMEVFHVISAHNADRVAEANRKMAVEQKLKRARRGR